MTMINNDLWNVICKNETEKYSWEVHASRIY